MRSLLLLYQQWNILTENRSRILPTGIFLSPIMDLQAFTATVVLLLTSHSGPASERLDFHTNKARVHGIAAQVLKVMDEKSSDTGGANFARHGALTIRSLSGLLQQTDDGANSDQLSLKVPLLGNVNIRRNMDPSPVPPTGTQQPAQILPNAGLWRPIEQFVSQPTSVAPLNAGVLFPAATQGQAEWQLNPLSWSIDDTTDSMFQDVFMADTFDQLGAWQGDYSNFQLSG